MAFICPIAHRQKMGFGCFWKALAPKLMVPKWGQDVLREGGSTLTRGQTDPRHTILKQPLAAGHSWSSMLRLVLPSQLPHLCQYTANPSTQPCRAPDVKHFNLECTDLSQQRSSKSSNQYKPYKIVNFMTCLENGTSKVWLKQNGLGKLNNFERKLK